MIRVVTNLLTNWNGSFVSFRVGWKLLDCSVVMKYMRNICMWKWNINMKVNLRRLHLIAYCILIHVFDISVLGLCYCSLVSLSLFFSLSPFCSLAKGSTEGVEIKKERKKQAKRQWAKEACKRRSKEEWLAHSKTSATCYMLHVSEWVSEWVRSRQGLFSFFPWNLASDCRLQLRDGVTPCRSHTHTNLLFKAKQRITKTREKNNISTCSHVIDSNTIKKCILLRRCGW